MKLKRVFLIIVISLLLTANTSVVASANGTDWPIPLPNCGIYYDTQDNIGTFENYKSEWFGGSSIIFTSSNGWEFHQVILLDHAGIPVVFYNLSPGTTSKIVPFHTSARFLYVVLTKKCVACHPTGKYVYTLSGNYPCNLITKDNSIPARFLDPEYTGPLCNLPALDHIWNGEWVKNEELDCGGYFVGGNHYDTSLGILP